MTITDPRARLLPVAIVLAVTTILGACSRPSSPSVRTERATPLVVDPCPGEVTARSVIAMSPTERLRCYSTATLSIRAFYPEVFSGGGCDGSVVAGSGWLDTCGFGASVISIAAAARDENTMSVHLRPPLLSSDIPKNSWVRITGHFDDEAAEDCHRIDGNGAVIADPLLVLECRQQFVATKVSLSP